MLKILLDFQRLRLMHTWVWQQLSIVIEISFTLEVFIDILYVHSSYEAGIFSLHFGIYSEHYNVNIINIMLGVDRQIKCWSTTKDYENSTITEIYNHDTEENDSKIPVIDSNNIECNEENGLDLNETKFVSFDRNDKIIISKNKKKKSKQKEKKKIHKELTKVNKLPMSLRLQWTIDHDSKINVVTGYKDGMTPLCGNSIFIADVTPNLTIYEIE